MTEKDFIDDPTLTIATFDYSATSEQIAKLSYSVRIDFCPPARVSSNGKTF